MSNNPATKAYQRRVVRLGDAIFYRLECRCIEDIIRQTDADAPDHLIDAALMRAAAICRSRIRLSMRQIRQCETNMESIRVLLSQPTFQIAEGEAA